jgi:hypothetical protein
MAIKSFVVMDKDRGETPVIGVVKNVYDDKAGKKSFYLRLKRMLAEHFDQFVVKMPDIVLFDDVAFRDVCVGLESDVPNEDVEVNIRIYETWIY